MPWQQEKESAGKCHMPRQTPTFPLILQAVRNCNIWFRYSTPVRFKALWFRNAAIYLKCINDALGATKIDVISSHIWFTWLPEIWEIFRRHKVAPLWKPGCGNWLHYEQLNGTKPNMLNLTCWCIMPPGGAEFCETPLPVNPMWRTASKSPVSLKQ